MKKYILLLTALLCCPTLWAQGNTFRIDVLSYQWTTNHRTLTFTYPGSARTSCNGSSNANGYVSSQGYFDASGTSSSTCTTTYTPPTNQTIDIQKPVVFILADSETSRMVLTCTRNVAWSQCKGLNPGTFTARNDKGHFEVQYFSGKSKEEWVKFNIVQQTAISRPAHQMTSQEQQSPAPASIEPPKPETTNATDSGFPAHWKSMTSGRLWTVRFDGEYLYAEMVVSQAFAKAGGFMLINAKKDGDNYVGNENAQAVSSSGRHCSMTVPFEFTMVTPQRIEGRAFAAPPNTQIDWNTCKNPAAPDWQPFVWIPVQ